MADSNFPQQLATRGGATAVVQGVRGLCYYGYVVGTMGQPMLWTLQAGKALILNHDSNFGRTKNDLTEMPAGVTPGDRYSVMPVSDGTAAIVVDSLLNREVCMCAEYMADDDGNEETVDGTQRAQMIADSLNAARATYESCTPEGAFA